MKESSQFNSKGICQALEVSSLPTYKTRTSHGKQRMELDGTTLELDGVMLELDSTMLELDGAMLEIY
jgi:hypothetical protein